TDAEALASAFEEAVAELGGLDVVVAAAGIAARGTVADTDPVDWDRTLAVNLRGVFLTARAAIPHLRAAGGGAIVNIASQLGLVAAANAAAYCASKGAVISRTRAMAIDHGPDGHAVARALLRRSDGPCGRAEGVRGHAVARAPRDGRGNRRLGGLPGLA